MSGADPRPEGARRPLESGPLVVEDVVSNPLPWLHAGLAERGGHVQRLAAWKTRLGPTEVLRMNSLGSWLHW